jgi:hypothetical protein
MKLIVDIDSAGGLDNQFIRMSNNGNLTEIYIYKYTLDKPKEIAHIIIKTQELISTIKTIK